MHVRIHARGMHGGHSTIIAKLPGGGTSSGFPPAPGSKYYTVVFPGVHLLWGGGVRLLYDTGAGHQQS